jgi:hypothetical protein
MQISAQVLFADYVWPNCTLHAVWGMQHFWYCSISARKLTYITEDGEVENITWSYFVVSSWIILAVNLSKKMDVHHKGGTPWFFFSGQERIHPCQFQLPIEKKNWEDIYIKSHVCKLVLRTDSSEYSRWSTYCKYPVDRGQYLFASLPSYLNCGYYIEPVLTEMHLNFILSF